MILKDKKAIVTGGTAGIGEAIALEFAEAGAQVVIFGTNSERGNHVAKQLPGGLFVQINVADAQAVKEAMKQAIDHLGGLDILVNNAGITHDQLLMRISEEDWDRVLDVNLKSCYSTCHTAVRTMMKSREGSIINVSSIVGITGNAGQVSYSASKAGMIGLTKALAKEVGARGVRVNCIAPGFIDTAMTGTLDEGLKEKMNKQIPLGRIGTPKDVAKAALFLASSQSDYITGQVLVVDGGMI